LLEPWWGLVEPASANRLETCARLHLIDGGLPPDAVQYPIYQQGRQIAVVDMAYLDEQVAVETDGREPHSQPDQFTWDRRRRNLLQEAGWKIVIFTRADMRNPAYLQQTVRKARARAA
jgi:hypothetical protein